MKSLSCINDEIEAFNRKLMKIVKTFNRVSIIEIVYSTGDLTKRGCHLSDIGNDKVSKQLFSQFLSVLHKMQVIPISLDWKRGYDFLYSTLTVDES